MKLLHANFVIPFYLSYSVFIYDFVTLLPKMTFSAVRFANFDNSTELCYEPRSLALPLDDEMQPANEQENREAPPVKLGTWRIRKLESFCGTVWRQLLRLRRRRRERRGERRRGRGGRETEREEKRRRREEEDNFPILQCNLPRSILLTAGAALIGDRSFLL